jgi:hypothetical protein
MEGSMRGSGKGGTSLFDVVEDNGRLVVRTRTAPYRPVLRILAWLTGGATIVLIGYLLATRQNPGYWWGAPVLLFVVLFLAARASDLQAAAKEAVFCFDRVEGRLTRNAELLTPINHISHMLVREVAVETGEAREFALVVALDDTRRILIAEAIDIPNARADIEAAAKRVADFIDVPVERGLRHPGESWMDL